MFISRNPQSVAFHGGHLVSAAPMFRKEYDKNFPHGFSWPRNFPRSHRAQPKATDDTEEWLGRTGVEMHREDLLCPDLLSEIILLGFGELIFVSLILFLMAALSRA